MAVDPIARTIATVSQDRRMSVFSIATGRALRSLRPQDSHDDGDVSGSSHVLASAFGSSTSSSGGDGAPTGSTAAAAAAAAAGAVGGGGPIKVTMSPTGQHVATASADRCVRILDMATGECVGRGRGHAEIVTGARFFCGGKRIVSTGGDGCVFVWRVGPLEKPPRAMPVDVVTTAAVSTVQAVEPVPQMPPTFPFRLSETGLPAWARSSRGDSGEARTAAAAFAEPRDEFPRRPARGRWAQRVGSEGVVLYSELPDNAYPVARLDDVLDRRYSLEPSADSPPSPILPHATGGATPANDIVVQDLDAASAASEPEEDGADVEDADQETEEDGAAGPEPDAADQTLFVDAADLLEPEEDPTAFLPTAESSPVPPEPTDDVQPPPPSASLNPQEAPSSASLPPIPLSSTTSLVSIASLASLDAEASDTDGLSSDDALARSDFDQYITRPVDFATANLDARSSFSAKHIVSRGVGRSAYSVEPQGVDVEAWSGEEGEEAEFAEEEEEEAAFDEPAPDEVASTAESEARCVAPDTAQAPETAPVPIQDPATPTTASRTLALRLKKEATAREVERMRTKLLSLGIVWRSIEAPGGIGSGPTDEDVDPDDAASSAVAPPPGPPEEDDIATDPLDIDSDSSPTPEPLVDASGPSAQQVSDSGTPESDPPPTDPPTHGSSSSPVRLDSESDDCGTYEAVFEDEEDDEEVEEDPALDAAFVGPGFASAVGSDGEAVELVRKEAGGGEIDVTAGARASAIVDSVDAAGGSWVGLGNSVAARCDEKAHSYSLPLTLPLDLTLLKSLASRTASALLNAPPTSPLARDLTHTLETVRAIADAALPAPARSRAALTDPDVVNLLERYSDLIVAMVRDKMRTPRAEAA
ncbi:hypothetical protein BDK51DRAFT_39058 [Blyttiomyces helicus]|uniref:Uncharacterized protein n=1 Tax=Blyttiomyces helicus TaxID=388810 RepID=A0A4P9W5K6_9FUNG|nr:hypothetical protein BDK51DRAFT_39058 [Blyttiomyces helicus]|eukprot:RKO86198.1 hypothetical protein BDK51DRAFT_39058 [Blyttiomyces helicus]